MGVREGVGLTQVSKGLRRAFLKFGLHKARGERKGKRK